ncbi:YkgJ family cysteine cluster protein [Leptospira alstonii]|uniref:YkgJ family cysteine cluster protein n=1 Tax=Leptospira alstonii TaxID=28452 RepID=UPI0007744F3B|nr:YkgJ family cysteine cluster protein [Leptospira alstonii]
MNLKNILNKVNGTPAASWLVPLINAYLINDERTEQDLKRIAGKTGRKIACRSGCSACCKNQSISLSEFEVAGISYYICELLDKEMQKRITDKLERYTSKTMECPFLIDERCSVYQFRPLVCRTFHVLDKECTISEDVSTSRPNDIALPSQETATLVAYEFFNIPIFRIRTLSQKKEAFESGLMVAIMQPMHTLNWSSLIENIKRFSSRKEP